MWPPVSQRPRTEPRWIQAKDWNQRGERLPGGEFWSPTPLRNKLLAPRIGGLASHNGTILEDVAVQWEAIIPTPEWRQLRAVLLDPKRRAGGRPARFLLSGFTYCGECSHHPRLAGRSFSDKNHGNRYLCQPAAGGCYLSVSAPELDEHITRIAWRLLDDDKVVRTLLKVGTDPDRVTQLQQDQAALFKRQATELPALIGKPGITTAVIEQAAADIAKQLAVIDAELGRLQPKRPFIRLGDTAVGIWLSGDLQQRRGLLAAVIARVVVHGAKPSAGRFDPDRVEVIPREELLTDPTIAKIVAQVLRRS
jgi:site-specific DNA recombinase